MQGFKNYQNELQAIKPHKVSKQKHILAIEDYKNFAGFTEKEIWGELEDNLSQYQNWIKEM